MAGQSDEARCVVLTPPGAAISEPLRALLEARAWHCVARDDPHLAMAELCLEDRARSTRRSWAPEPEPNLALVLDVPPAATSDPNLCRDLLAAVARYLPGASICEHRDGELQSLRTGAGDDGAGAAHSTAASERVATTDHESRAEPAPVLIMPEEIEMLLRTDDDDDAAG